MLKKNELSTLAVYLMSAILLIGVVALADPGLQTAWIFTQLKLVIAVIAVGLAIMFFVQKATAKMIITIVVGALLYAFAAAPEGMLSGLGVFLKGLFGL